jgi:hypothetical protein
MSMNPHHSFKLVQIRGGNDIERECEQPILELGYTTHKGNNLAIPSYGPYMWSKLIFGALAMISSCIREVPKVSKPLRESERWCDP